MKYKERNLARIHVDRIEEKKDELRKKIPSQKYIENGIKSSCIICMEDFVNGILIRKLLCEHIFHDKCIDEWYTTNPKCPLCKRDMFESALEVSDMPG